MDKKDELVSTLMKIGINAIDSNGKWMTRDEILESLSSIWHLLKPFQKEHIAILMAGQYRKNKFKSIMEIRGE